jgi:hypothetical protein
MRRFLAFLFLCFAASTVAAVVIVEWDANPETNIAGYKVYWGEATRTYDNVSDVGDATSFTDTFPLGNYFLAVTAYNTEGFESDFSEEMALAIIAPPVLRFESNALTWSGSGAWQVCWTNALRTNQQIIFTNCVPLGMFRSSCMISVRRFEFGATNVLSDFAAPVFYDPPRPVQSLLVRFVLQKTTDLNEPFRDFAEEFFTDGITNQAFYRARLEMKRTGLRVK